MPASSGTRYGNGAGIGGPANGAGVAERFASDVQPTGEAKSDGHRRRREMREYLENNRMVFAKKIVALAAQAESQVVELNASVAGLKYLDGDKQQVTGIDDGPLQTVLRIECDGLQLANRFNSLTSPVGNSEPTMSAPSDTQSE